MLRTSGLCLAAVVFGLGISNVAMADDYGHLEGTITFKGDIPKPLVLVKKGDLKVNDPKICSKHDVLSEELLVDPKTKGIANVFIFRYYKRSEKKVVHPELAVSKKKELVFDQEGCRFKPHAMIVRTDQTVIVKSNDGCAHNTHTFPIKNDPVNFLLKPLDREGVPIVYKNREILPIPVQCDVHRWMKAWWLILDHPYAALTDKTGKYRIANLPAGEHTFRVWQEKKGWLPEAKMRNQKVTIKKGETTKLDLVIPASAFEEKK